MRHERDIYEEGISYRIFRTYASSNVSFRGGGAFDPFLKIAGSLFSVKENKPMVRVVFFHRHAVPAERLLPKGRTAGLGSADTTAPRRGEALAGGNLCSEGIYATRPLHQPRQMG
ncbi:uncharacterized protein PHACADRAFT_253534 [Phanerochaete carnosa HHB-10118-sp]|uniref:Uncharacterized protein n=1 Tax=Phanerochaete carnosa (strain HHB-10118-sp) TaxID=650164 RepID=K5X103_PHACS|nr:uncharacterized protein PHACADRAFT_253534 [Phanerochaete carnosa HHB-10118-sp]EKM56427.1 hypothetical protein PHACADRAFT_253534 [Phanerochaete carnosa HHB-10118-sp]